MVSGPNLLSGTNTKPSQVKSATVCSKKCGNGIHCHVRCFREYFQKGISDSEFPMEGKDRPNKHGKKAGHEKSIHDSPSNHTSIPSNRTSTPDTPLNRTSALDIPLNRNSTLDTPLNRNSTLDTPLNRNSTLDTPSNHTSTLDIPSKNNSTHDKPAKSKKTHQVPKQAKTNAPVDVLKSSSTIHSTSSPTKPAGTTGLSPLPTLNSSILSSGPLPNKPSTASPKPTDPAAPTANQGHPGARASLLTLVISWIVSAAM
ncbi:hypothetical protein K493DRAFT_306641 [Basidiobolus meristosporus CBS 931.73]|uniref:Uncharacterized protein n=1 Tax=Basidiobolus meristosporus CBS 931.73 TaxID=1314790 RepID=A0A1Y1XRM1_9FUNG|nr:hypothetical protein K493DRAFT_306641 [Basidiobolus meristosporus CBS 931.73]|eukprot:ORX88412.1 hypothetical protein K493DRAFT_306641 [Basidiobolus meristosporus CBS 931.73]